MKRSIPQIYGQLVCPKCSLCIAEFINGRLYSLSLDSSMYLHNHCYSISHGKGESHHANR